MEEFECKLYICCKGNNHSHIGHSEMRPNCKEEWNTKSAMFSQHYYACVSLVCSIFFWIFNILTLNATNLGETECTDAELIANK